MTPVLADILAGQAAALGAPQPPEALGDYVAGRLGLVSMLARLAAQEAERGPAARTLENSAMRSLYARVADDYAAALEGRLANAASRPPRGYAWSQLDADNADLRRLLIDLHEAAEARGDKALDQEILELYVSMALARRLDLPPAQN
jgi:hypothetical protein